VPKYRKTRRKGTVLPPAAIAGGILLLSSYLMPLLGFLVGIILTIVALVDWRNRSHRRALDHRRWSVTSSLASLRQEDFERHVGATYEALGYKVSYTPRARDQGIDVIASRNAERVGIQCKRSPETTPNSAIQAAFAGKAYYECTSAAVVALGGFSSPARDLATSLNVALIDAATYADLVDRAGPAAKPATFDSRAALRPAITFALAIVCVVLATIHSAR